MFRRSARRTARRTSRRMARRQDGGQPQPEAQTDQPDQTAKLNELAELHAAGQLTDEEFAAAKANLLGL